MGSSWAVEEDDEEAEETAAVVGPLAWSTAFLEDWSGDWDSSRGGGKLLSEFSDELISSANKHWDSCDDDDASSCFWLVTGGGELCVEWFDLRLDRLLLLFMFTAAIVLFALLLISGVDGEEVSDWWWWWLWWLWWLLFPGWDTLGFVLLLLNGGAELLWNLLLVATRN